MRDGEQAAPGAPRWATLSAPGGRRGNEDRAGETATPTGHAFVVADGLGGHAAGEIAAETCVRSVCEALKAAEFSRDALGTSFEAAQRAVQEAQREAAAAGCRTTAVVLLLAGDRALWGHLGDSRLYLFRGGRVIHQTLDHSVPQALVQTGAILPSEIRSHRDRNRLLRSLGGEGEAAATLLQAPLALQPGDVFLLCTDGFWELVTEAEMEEDLRGAKDPQEWLKRLESRLLAKASGEFDNYTATAVFPSSPASGLARLGGPALALAVAAALLAAIALERCQREPPGLILGSGAAHELPVAEAGLGSPRAPRLHSSPAMIARARGV
jgi:serine/threonine protein phosphatase PrpC